jgi:hypothetical protein
MYERRQVQSELNSPLSAKSHLPKCRTGRANSSIGVSLLEMKKMEVNLEILR